ncbi:MAG: 16S rRNA (guanine(966)-N(2))-methyltransferase RsmD [Rothia sp. (in: high G+C Gram-positive bacteria)]|nr:16S rRNA (guanine(966)-N(2))-methyltransferase RsmD [Rothia sp. (in: high G+C Gram-positive bacteria)]
MIRIIAGVSKGMRLANLPGNNTRPTTDRVKEALFSRLDAYGVLADARVLDLFAGSGALGCEALSRGAASADFVDSYAKARPVIEKNIAGLKGAGAVGRARVYTASATSFLGQCSSGQGWDLVFLDPPYDYANDKLLLVLDLLLSCLTPGAVLVVERSAFTPQAQWPQALEQFAHKKYGQTQLYFLQPVTEQQAS